jgi:hypothetical protein
MAAPQSRDLVALARSFGFDCAFYSPPEAFRQLGIKRSFGWELIARGTLETIHQTPRKVVVSATSMAGYMHARQQDPPDRKRAHDKAVARRQKAKRRRDAVTKRRDAS